MASLIRMVLINTHLPGVVELALNGHTNICGTNASGKTTLQRLLPVFYGEYPSRVVPATRDSFERWYLPTSSSFIIYEYQREDNELYQAILSSAGEGKGVHYRFVGKGFEIEDYIKNRTEDEAVHFHLAGEMGRIFKALGVAITPQLNTREFRAIIQNDRNLLDTGSNRRELRGFAQQFSLCPMQDTLRHIEKLAKAVHSKEGKMETIKSMIAAILEEDGVTPPQSRIQPQQVENWIKESQLVKGFEALRPEVEKLDQTRTELDQLELKLGALTGQYQQDEVQESQRQQSAQNTAQEQKLALKMLDSQWRELRDDLNLELSAAKGDVRKCEDELDAIEKQHDDFIGNQVEQAKLDLENLPADEDRYEQLQERHQLITEKHQDIEAAYNARRSKISDSLHQALDKLHQDQDILREKRDRQKEQARQDVQQLDDMLREQKQLQLDLHQEKLHELALQRSTFEMRVESVTYNEQEKQSMAVFEQRITDAEDKLAEYDHQLENCQNTERQQRVNRDQLAETLRQYGVKRVHAEKAFAEIQALLFPQANTLLEFLRQEQPGWEQDLGKVIHADLLQRTDLRPSFSVQDAPNFFGLTLDLKALNVPDYAQTEQDLQQKLQTAETQLADIEQAFAQHEQKLQKLNQQLEQATRACTLARSAYQQQKQDLQRLRDEKRSYHQKAETAVKERKAQAGKELVQLKHTENRLKTEHTDWLSQHQQQALEARMEKQAHWQEIIGELEAQLSQAKQQMSSRKQQAEQEQKACQQWYQGELKSRGVDEQSIVDLKRELQQLQQHIVKVKQRQSEVLRYEDWLTNTWRLRKPKLTEQLLEAKRAFTDLDAQLKKEQAKVSEQRKANEQSLRDAEQNQISASENITKLRQLNRQLQELALPETDLVLEGALDERLRQGEQLLYKRHELQNLVKQYVEHFDQVIAAKSGSSIAEIWERAREETSSTNDQGIRLYDHRKQALALIQLLNEVVPLRLEGIKDQGRNFGLNLYNYHSVLDGIDKRIVNQSARITREVSDELFLDGVSESAVHIRSRITELEFWPELKRFVSAYEAWQADGFQDLPSEDYIQAMRRALEIIGRNALSGQLSSLLDIELRLKEGNSDLVIRTDRQLNESSSHGMAYLILCKFLLAFTRLLRSNNQVTIHWPIDELGTLHHKNVKKIFDACQNNNIAILGAFPNPDADVLALFNNRYIINKQTRQLQVVKPKINPLQQKLAQRLQQQTDQDSFDNREQSA